MDEATRLTVIKQLLDDRDHLLLQRVDLRRKIKELADHDAKLAVKLNDIRSAGRLFGQSIAVPADVRDYETLEKLNAVMAKQRSGRRWVPGQSTPTAKEKVEQVEKDEPEGTRIRDRVLERLKGQSDGAKAADLRAYLETAHGTKTHEKTVGMTLYRLAKEGLVRRTGRTWFFVPPEAEAKNPGGSTPGSARNTKVVMKGG